MTKKLAENPFLLLSLTCVFGILILNLVTVAEIQVPIRRCGEYDPIDWIDLHNLYLDPPCLNDTKGYCQVPLGKNVTLKADFEMLESATNLSLLITRVDDYFGFETNIWSEFGACNLFNLSCPQVKNAFVYSFIDRHVPEFVPPLKSTIRVRLIGRNLTDDGTKEHDVPLKTKKTVLMCREVDLEFYRDL